MNDQNAMMSVLSSLSTSVPVLIAYVVGLILAISKWNQHPRTSMFAASGAGLLLIVTPLARIAFIVLPMRMRADGATTVSLQPLLMGIGLLSGLLQAVGVALLIAAIFVERGQPSREAMR